MPPPLAIVRFSTSPAALLTRGGLRAKLRLAPTQLKTKEDLMTTPIATALRRVAVQVA
jgi:hypothetical protein